MDSREAGARAPTAGLRILDDLHAQYLAGGSHEAPASREQRLYEMLAYRKDEVTMTLLLMTPEGDPCHYVMNNALLGMRYNRDSERVEMHAARPLHQEIVLQSLRKSCAACKAHEEDKRAPKCERQGKYHPIVYKTSTKSGTGQQHRMIVAMGGTVEDNVLCDVDPETGLFTLEPLEAKKALRQWGENAVRATRRWVDREKKKGDRWKIREVRHFELYGNAALSGVIRQDVPAMTAD
jgi:hypothetical protein